MNRGLSSTILTAMAGTPSMVFLVDFAFDAATEYHATGPANIVYGGNTYLAGTFVMDVGPVAETDDLRNNGVQLMIGAADQSNIATLLGDVTHRKVTIQLALLGADGQVLDVMGYHTGWIDGVSGEEDMESSTMTLTVASHLSHYNTTAGTLTTDASQQREFTGDLGMVFASSVYEDRTWKR